MGTQKLSRMWRNGEVRDYQAQKESKLDGTQECTHATDAKMQFCHLFLTLWRTFVNHSVSCRALTSPTVSSSRPRGSLRSGGARPEAKAVTCCLSRELKKMTRLEKA